MPEETTTYGKWIYHIARNWKPPDDVSLFQMLGFCAAMCTYGRNGRNIYPSAESMAKRAHCAISTVKRLRRRAIECGLFTDTGRRFNNIAVLAIAIPPDWPRDEPVRAQASETQDVPDEPPEDDGPPVAVSSVVHTGTPGRGCDGCRTLVRAGCNGTEMAAMHSEAVSSLAPQPCHL